MYELSWDKFVKNETTLCKTFSSMTIFLNLCLVDNFIDFLELSMFINASLCLIY